MTESMGDYRRQVGRKRAETVRNPSFCPPFRLQTKAFGHAGGSCSRSHRARSLRPNSSSRLRCPPADSASGRPHRAAGTSRPRGHPTTLPGACHRRWLGAGPVLGRPVRSLKRHRRRRLSRQSPLARTTRHRPGGGTCGRSTSRNRRSPVLFQGGFTARPPEFLGDDAIVLGAIVPYQPRGLGLDQARVRP